MRIPIRPEFTPSPVSRIDTAGLIVKLILLTLLWRFDAPWSLWAVSVAVVLLVHHIRHRATAAALERAKEEAIDQMIEAALSARQTQSTHPVLHQTFVPGVEDDAP